MTQLGKKALAMVLDAAPDAMLSINKKGSVVMANAQAERLFGFRRKKMLGVSAATLVELDNSGAGKLTTNLLTVGRRSDGSEFQAEISVSKIKTKQGRFVTAAIRDISERTEQEGVRNRVKAEAERVRIEAEAELVKAEGEKAEAESVRLEVEVRRVEAEVEKTHAEREKAEAERVRLEAEAELVKAEGEKAEAESVRLEVEVERVKAEVEKTHAEREKAEAERVRLEAEVERVKAEVEKAEAERIRLEAEVERVKAEVEKAEAERVRLETEVEHERIQGQLHQSQRMESLGQLAGGVAHDFNNLLAVILNYASFVGEELAKAAAVPTGERWLEPLKDVKQIQIATERASSLTHQLLSFARREVVQARALSFNSAIANLEDILRRTIGEQIELIVDLEDDLPMVMADPGQIEQIILNLAINARDAMPSGGTLAIETSSTFVTTGSWSAFGAPTGSYVCLRVSDNGVGMPAEVLDRAFEPFFTTKPRGEGSGLGLATVFGIVTQSGGFTKIYSDEGVGTAITIILPLAEGESTRDASRRDEVTGSLKGVETILVVDDEEGLREVTRRILTRSGYTVLSARGGDEAIEIATSHVGTIDLLLTDVIMPKMQGPTVAKELERLRPGIRILFMSGHAQPVLEAESILGTEFSLVEKPFDQMTLLECVREVLDAKQLHDDSTPSTP